MPFSIASSLGQKPDRAGCLLCFSVVFGNSNGLAVVDYLQKTLLLNMGTSELYSPSDPYHRQPRSPRKVRQSSGGELPSQRFCISRPVSPVGQSSLPIAQAA